MAKILGLAAASWQSMTKDWWHIVLGAVLLGSLVMSTVYLLTRLGIYGSQAWRNRRLQDASLPRAVADFLRTRQPPTPREKSQMQKLSKPKSCGYYLGAFESPPTPAQDRLLSTYDLLVVDIARIGVKEALAIGAHRHILARLDVSILVSDIGDDRVESTLAALQAVFAWFDRHFSATGEKPVHVDGVILANWESSFTSTILNAIIAYISSYDMSVRLEISAPSFIPPKQCQTLDLHLLNGLIFRNGTILPDGSHRDYFQMAALRPALNAIARRSPRAMVMVLDVVRDEVTVSEPVVRRSVEWCRFNTALLWIGAESALYDAEAAEERVQRGEPLGALMWLKDDVNVQLQKIWTSNDQISKHTVTDADVYQQLDHWIPGSSTEFEDSIHSSPAKNIDLHPLEYSPRGHEYTGFGCFQLGLDCTAKDAAAIVDKQRRLFELNLLEMIPVERLSSYVTPLRNLCLCADSWSSSPHDLWAVRELADVLATASSSTPSSDARVRIFRGLNSGFRTSLETQFWGVSALDLDTGVMDIYISEKATDLLGTILHTFMSSRECSRATCFAAEMVLAREQTGEWNERWSLPMRFVADIEKLTPSETLLLLKRISGCTSGRDDILPRIEAFCQYQLLDVPTTMQLRAMSATAYPRGETTASELVTARMEWYQAQQCAVPRFDDAIDVFNAVENQISRVLLSRDTAAVSSIQNIMHAVLQPGKIDAAGDLFALAVFCALRKLAIDEVYLEILDRNPLPHPHADQAACFAEMFALGSNCEGYFDMTSSVLGQLLAERYDAYYHIHQPPRRDDSTTEAPTSYASKLIDIDHLAQSTPQPWYYAVTFLGIFAIPALIDILLLTILGRGLYLSTYMSNDVKSMATIALMVSLVLTGAIGTWVGSGGSYYLHSMAFPAANMFVLTRFVAGVAICCAGGTLAFVVIGLIKGWLAGFVFFAYLLLLSTYLTTLATLSIYQLPGFMFQSGRTTIVRCLPILTISPILTMWIGHDLLVYLLVLTTFVVLLLLGLRSTIAQWATWYQHVPTINDSDLAEWYEKLPSTQDDKSATAKDITESTAARRALHTAVTTEINRHPWQRPTSDAFVLRLADGYHATRFLMDWYCKYSRTKMPYCYSPTWNLQCKAAIDTLRDMQKGLKLHGAFLHWRHAGVEVWCGTLYFVVALLDKWISYFTGASLVGLSAAGSEEFRFAVGFGLSYYLVAAVVLDAVAQPLWTLAKKQTDATISSIKVLHEAAGMTARTKRKLYWSNLTSFFFGHLWGVSLSTSLMWTFSLTRDSTIMYFAYTAAYTGLLWYQYNRVFAGVLIMKDLMAAAVVGVITGSLLHHFMPSFIYSSVVGMGAGTWTAAILSLYTARIGWPSRTPRTEGLIHRVETKFHAFRPLDPHHAPSQMSLSQLYEALCAKPQESRLRVTPIMHPGLEIATLLLGPSSRSRPDCVRDAFPDADERFYELVELWKNGRIVLDMMSTRNLSDEHKDVRSLCTTNDSNWHVLVFVGLDAAGSQWQMDIRHNCRIAAEALVRAYYECILGYPPYLAELAETLVVEAAATSEVPTIAISESIKHHVQRGRKGRDQATTALERYKLRYSLLGMNPDIEWDGCSKPVRMSLLSRFLAETTSVDHDLAVWLEKRPSTSIGPHKARQSSVCELGRQWTDHILCYTDNVKETSADHADPPLSSPTSTVRKISHEARASQPWRLVIKDMLGQLANNISLCAKFIVVSVVADPDFQRELDYLISQKPRIIKWPITMFLNGTWLFCRAMQDVLLPYFLFHQQPAIAKLHRNMKGLTTSIKKDRVLVDGFDGTFTWFYKDGADGSVKLMQYAGRHTTEPDLCSMMSVDTYDDKLLLRQRETYTDGHLHNMFEYEYADHAVQRPRIPILRRCLRGHLQGHVARYDAKGHIVSGSAIKDGNLIEFDFAYRKNAKYEDELLRCVYRLSFIDIKVSFCTPPPNPKKLNRWIPHSKVMEATFRQGDEIYHCSWDYDHKFHPILTTTLNGMDVETPPMIAHDWFKVLKKPSNCSFINDNPLTNFQRRRSNYIERLFRRNTRWSPISTARGRTQLWKAWKQGKDCDAVTARWLDERALRSDRVLKPYWRRRDIGHLLGAKTCLDAQVDTIMARVDVDSDISSWTPLAFKISDLYSFGTGGDARINTRTQSTQLRDTESSLHVLAHDTGTWPNEGGGVSACRRDMVNGLDSIKWHIIAENANDFGVPKFQIERNVQSLSVLPLWGLDFLTPTHGIFRDILDSAVQERSHETREDDIRKRFIPILAALVRCARAINLTQEHLDAAGTALLALNDYFENSRHWSDVWLSDVVSDAWRQLWLSDDIENTRPISQWLDAEKPTLAHLDNALNMWHRYLFIFSLPVPSQIPDVFQASHHFAGASYGVLCKMKHGCTLHVWDHCISWREVTVFLSSAMSFDPPFVCNALISLSRVTAALCLHNADVVLPCADFFNPGWEVEVGTQQGVLCHRRKFVRKIDPVVNGICNMNSFEPIAEIKSDKPTVVMLSHVRFVKDIKNAVLAADKIVHEWGVQDYRLHIYGDMEKAPTYAVECQEIIAAKGLRDHVVLKGLGKPSTVLEDAWIFLNSSISEGLPLAMGEAALTGVPVVCTDVGASFRVVTDPVTGKRFSAVVAPNDAHSLALAQVKVLAMLDEWAEYADDDDNDADAKETAAIMSRGGPTAADGPAIQARMYAKAPQRRRLGMMGRANVLTSFSEERYLRQHEQMLWIGKYQNPRPRLWRRGSALDYQPGCSTSASTGSSSQASNWTLHELDPFTISHKGGGSSGSPERLDSSTSLGGSSAVTLMPPGLSSSGTSSPRGGNHLSASSPSSRHGGRDGSGSYGLTTPQGQNSWSFGTSDPMMGHRDGSWSGSGSERSSRIVSLERMV